MTCREVQRSITGLDGMARLGAALIASEASNGSRVSIAGAGSGREVDMLGARARTPEIAAADPRDQNLPGAMRMAHDISFSEEITFVEGTVDEPVCGLWLPQ